MYNPVDCTPLSSSYSSCSNPVRLRAFIKYFIPHAVSLETAVVNKERKYIAKLMCEAAVVKKLLSIKELKKELIQTLHAQNKRSNRCVNVIFRYTLINYTLNTGCQNLIALIDGRRLREAIILITLTMSTKLICRFL